MEKTRSRRSFLKQALKTVAVGAGGLAMGLSSAAPAQACAIYCSGNVTNNQMDAPCGWCGENRRHTYYYQKTCWTACGYSFDHCSTTPGGFCMSRNYC
jgi:hypothetical protein